MDQHGFVWRPMGVGGADGAQAGPVLALALKLRLCPHSGQRAALLTRRHCDGRRAGGAHLETVALLPQPGDTHTQSQTDER